MVQKKKHRKQLAKIRQKYIEKQKQQQPEIDFDTSAYVVYNNLQFPYPCLSFDIIKDSLGDDPGRVKKFPLSFYLVAGAQTPQDVESNFMYVSKIDNVHPLQQETENEKEEGEDEEDENEHEDPQKVPRLSTIKVPINGCVNRIRATKMSGKTFSATWTDKGKVHIHDITTPVQAVSDLKSIQTYTAHRIENKPIFTFGGHLTEGFAIDWSPVTTAALATGDCKKNIHIWKLKGSNNWQVDQQPLVGHESSVEDIKWSPSESDILASCSVDKSIRLWDLREKVISRCTSSILNAHSSDVNVIDWNKRNNNLLVSGGDDGIVKVWDLRHLGKEDSAPQTVAQFCYHNKPVTSVEWNPKDETVIAVSSEDDKLTIWDLGVERDEEAEKEIERQLEQQMEVDKKGDENDNDDEIQDDESEDEVDDEEIDEEEKEEDEGVEYDDLDFKKIPEQMLFLHQGQMEIKELHWHPQIEGLLLSSALNGLNIFKTISA